MMKQISEFETKSVLPGESESTCTITLKRKQESGWPNVNTNKVYPNLEQELQRYLGRFRQMGMDPPLLVFHKGDDPCSLEAKLNLAEIPQERIIGSVEMIGPQYCWLKLNNEGTRLVQEGLINDNTKVYFAYLVQDGTVYMVCRAYLDFNDYLEDNNGARQDDGQDSDKIADSISLTTEEIKAGIARE